MSTDLFGYPLAPQLPISTRKPKKASQRKTLESKRENYLRLLSSEKTVDKLIKKFEAATSGQLFDRVLEYVKFFELDALSSDQSTPRTTGIETVDEVSFISDALDIPHTPWGPVWLKDVNGFTWSKEAIHYLQTRLFDESFDEFAKLNNEEDVWSVLKWIFMPAIKYKYIFDSNGKSHALRIHERDETFSFANCCMASGMDPDVLRNGVRGQISAELYEATMKVNTFYWPSH